MIDDDVHRTNCIDQVLTKLEFPWFALVNLDADPFSYYNFGAISLFTPTISYSLKTVSFCMMT